MDVATNPSAFDKDFGYLMPFLDKVAAAAAGLEDASAREELTRLMAEEKARWARAQELLRGASGASSPGVRAPPAEARVDQPPPGAPAGLTVGSLRGVAPVKSRRR
ncbi:hypothetical protein NVS55_14225 [Myxococcus stipitatus]|uniref:hypothetical protein n=1 Tax=Myxococcus stipitatus TaxID=83455 RepID=UPI0031450877